MKSRYAFLVLFILLTIGVVSVFPAMAFEDDVQRYSIDFEDKWELYLASDAHGTSSVTDVNYPTTEPTSRALYMNCYGDGYYSGAWTGYGYARLTSYEMINPDYFAFTMYEGYASGYDSITCELKVTYLSADRSTVIDSYTILNGKVSGGVTISEPTRFELVKSGTSLTVYANGDIWLVDSLAYDQPVYVKIEANARGNDIGSRDAYVHARLDDFSDSSILGLRESWSPVDDNITSSYGIQFYDSYPSSTFTVDLVRLSDSYTAATETVINYTGFVHFDRLTVLDENYGLYKLDLKRDATSIDTAYITYKTADTIGSIAFDQDNYVSDETATITYSLSSPDFVTYTYKADITDLTGATLATETITSLSGSYDYTFTDYETGSYYVLFNRITKATGTEVLFAYDYCDINEALKIEGNTYIFNGTIADNATISMLQGSTYYNTTSNTSGWYEQSDMSIDVATTFNANTTSANLTEFTFIPESAGVIDVDLILFPNMTDYWGAGNTTAYGLIYGTYHQPIDGATVTIFNGTWSNTTNASSTGFYMFNDLINASNYFINASASGYDTSEDYNVSMVNNTRQDIELTARYTVTIQARDTTTGSYISEFDAYIDGAVSSTTNGTIIFTDVTYGAYSFSVSADDYYPSSKSYVIDEDREITFDLTRLESKYYNPHYVKFIVKDIWRTTYSGVSVNAHQGGSASGDTYAAGETGADGSITFQMYENQEYTLTFVDSPNGIDETLTLYPRNDEYNVYVITQTIIPDDQYSSEELDISVSKELINNTHAYINVTYLDNLAETESLKVYLNQSTTSDLFNQTVIDSYSEVTNNVTISFIVEDYAGETYFVNVNVDHTTFDEVKRSYAVYFDGMTDDHGFSQVYIWLSIGGIMFTGMIFKATNARQGAFVVCVVAWVFIILGWFDNLGDKGVLAITAGVTLATILSIAAIMAKGEKEG